ncbi:MAG: hypothetical protein HDR15_12940 [Lachnospiraceae bacterium]|nr:hypothetical protein [Lachnospiraceae bacterium]
MNKVLRKKDIILSIGRVSAVMLSIFFLLSALSGCAAKGREAGTNPPEEVGQPEGAEEPQVVKPLKETRRSEDEDLSGMEEGTADVPLQGTPEDLADVTPHGIPEDLADVTFQEIPEEWEMVDSFLIYPLRAYRAPEESGGVYGNYRRTSLYTVLQDTGEIVRFRSMFFWLEDGIVEIWDEMQDELIFASKAVLKEDGEPENGDYYDHILRHGGWSEIPCDVFGKIIYAGEDYSLHGVEYAGKEEFLEAMGFAGEEPFYACDGDMWGHSALELYYDEYSGRGCGLSYVYNMSYEGELMPEAVYGWSFDHVGHDEFVHDPYLLEMIGGGTGKSFQDYTETYQYRTDGRLRRFLTEGMMDHESGAAMTTLLELRYEYRDDGSLAVRYYHHNHLVRSSTDMIINSYYDGLERLMYEYHYVTHGSVEHYYIYRNGSSRPAYCLILDSYGTYGVQLIEYEN